LEITTVSLPNATLGVLYSTTLESSGGIEPVSWSVNPPLPDNNLSLNPTTGVISGIPTGATQATLTFSVQDSSTPPRKANKDFTLTIAPP
jgi:hypothetical protein